MVDQNIPEWKEKYGTAFMSLMLVKLGGIESISLKQLEKFPEGECVERGWDPETESFTIAVNAEALEVAYKVRKKRKRGKIKKATVMERLKLVGR